MHIKTALAFGNFKKKQVNRLQAWAPFSKVPQTHTNTYRMCEYDNHILGSSPVLQSSYVMLRFPLSDLLK